MTGDEEMRAQIETYRQLVLAYEELNDEIQRLLTASGGTENMSTDEFTRYRKLAHQRDEALNEMRILEKVLLDEDTRQ